MVAGQVSEDAAGKVDTLDAALNTGMGAHLHEGILTSRLHHLVQQSVEGQVVGSSLLGFLLGRVDDILYRGQQSGLVAHQTGHLIEQRCGRRLAVSARDTHEFQMA